METYWYAHVLMRREDDICEYDDLITASGGPVDADAVVQSVLDLMIARLPQLKGGEVTVFAVRQIG